MTIYTRRGDTGETSLIFGTKVSKDHPRIKAAGSIDELNATLGTATSFIKEPRIVKILESIQNELFNIGAEIASQQKLMKNTKGFYQLDRLKIDDLELKIDQYDSKLPPLRTFILPSGTNAAALLHLARTVCRRAEREIVTLSKNGQVNPNILAYLNRLSDLLFVLARYINRRSGRKEIPWQKY
ncbi:MAG: ATP:cob(I)alamin adenosyltransferase [Candidatus Woykebacteria bacterium RBG_19FT_COMBO_43_10]|uniref:Corrinoid adenosyltransferase n=1 Tax=Candidatus Woykebacteria bacterium RBG_19FT_COMBO_43_10 TaxID=1802598 RepID=A0A1G1WGS2_9BACT|nr:MAG: ATP:cob(I)alamin adenosyltransferase [Candidatus Woykebacteria bacterium RBG_19FT_COMBO_43_10]